MESVARLTGEDIAREAYHIRLAFYLRELAGVLVGAMRQHVTNLGSGPETWMSSMEASGTALLLYVAAMCLLPRMGLHGFFFPGTWIISVLLLVCCSWQAGRTLRVLSRPSPPMAALRSLVFCGCSLLAVWVAERAWDNFVVQNPRPMSYTLPGLDIVVSRPGASFPLSAGVRFSSTKILPDGTAMVMHDHVAGHVPPYQLLGSIMACAVALWARRLSGVHQLAAGGVE